MTLKRIIVITGLILTGVALSAIAARRHWFGLGNNNKAQVLPAARDEYNKLSAAFATMDSSLHLEGVIELYDTQNPGEIRETLPFSYLKNGNALMAMLGGIQTISNGNLVLQLDTINKYIALGQLTDSTQHALQASLLPFDQLFGDTSVFKVRATVANAGQQRILSIQNERIPEIKEFRVIYDTTTYQVQSCEIEWWKKNAVQAGEKEMQKTWVTKTHYRYLAATVFQPEEEMKKVIMLKENVLQPTEAYKNYEIHASH